MDIFDIKKNLGGNETRTRDPDLGKVVLYQLSYSRLGVLKLCVSCDTFKFWAGNETRTRDPDLGKVVLYQLSYSRLGVLVLAYLAILFKFWSGKRDSNSRPRPWQGRALPTELFPQICTAFVAVVTRISLSLREAHYTRNPFSCNPLNAIFRKSVQVLI